MKNAQMSLAKKFFALFPKLKKVRRSLRTRGRNCLRTPASTAAAQLEDSVEWVRLKDDNSGKPYYWNRRSFSAVWQPPPGVKVVWNGERNEEGLVWYWHTENACLHV